MSIEFLLVSFPEQRAVLADGNAVGFTNHTMLLPGDEYLITLDGGGYQPLSQDIVLSGTSLVKPMVISFTSAAARAAAVAPGAPAAGTTATAMPTSGAATTTAPAAGTTTPAAGTTAPATGATAPVAGAATPAKPAAGPAIRTKPAAGAKKKKNV
jgi:hypothetical protein